jgi:hypothetical protein
MSSQSLIVLVFLFSSRAVSAKEQPLSGPQIKTTKNREKTLDGVYR